ncbi:MAG: sialate O-acetylesterase [Planctomycetes bacterium]|nr:sialate O-acetylesterase [Planctomycetota bacterium]
MHGSSRLAILLALWAALGPGRAPAQELPPIKVVVLAGQSNMEGKARNTLFDHQATAEETAPLFAHLRDGDRWITRDDVFVSFLDRAGPLTIGYGSPGRTGVELELGTVLGDRFDEPVLLIKTAWGGHSLYRDFRPPSAGLPPDEALDVELGQARDRVRQRNESQHRDDPLPTLDEIRSAYGRSYRAMLAEVHRVLDGRDALFPQLAGREAELVGFVWFQGWNDQYGGAETEYEANLVHLIHDVRRDLGRPALPVVIGVMGQNGSKPAARAMKVIQDAQLAVGARPEFAGNVVSVRTDELVDTAAEQLYPTWRENTERWEQVGSDHAYHYLGSAIWMLRIGHAFGDALVGMLD